MIKFFLKDTEQEVKVGEKVKFKTTTNTPYGETTCDIEVYVTERMLQKLLKDGIVVKKKVSDTPDLEDYKPYIWNIAKKMHIKFKDVLILMNGFTNISPNACNILMLESMAEIMNKGKKGTPQFYIVLDNNNVTHVSSVETNLAIPMFISVDDATKAAKLIQPFYAKQED